MRRTETWTWILIGAPVPERPNFPQASQLLALHKRVRVTSSWVSAHAHPLRAPTDRRHQSLPYRPLLCPKITYLECQLSRSMPTPARVLPHHQGSAKRQEECQTLRLELQLRSTPRPRGGRVPPYQQPAVFERPIC